MNNPFNEFNEYLQSEEYENTNIKERFIKASLLTPNNDQIRKWEGYQALRQKANERLFSYGERQGLSKQQTRRKYQDVFMIDDNLEFNNKVFEVVHYGY